MMRAGTFISRATSGLVDAWAASWVYHVVADNEWLARRSHFIRACRAEPGGWYPLELVYCNRPTGSSVLERSIDRYYLNSPMARAARVRFAHTLGWLGDRADACLCAKGQVSILSLACGSARDVLTAFAGHPNQGSITCLGVDRDRKALEYAAACARNVGLPHFRFERGNALSCLQRCKRRFDLAVVLGLFDYFADPAARKLLNRLHSLLKGEGRLLFGMTLRNPSRLFFERRLKWRLVYRNSRQVMAVARAVPFSRVRTYANCNNCFLLVECEKAAIAVDERTTGDE